MRQHAAGGFLLFGYVVMPDHLHLLIAPAAADLTGVMREFKSCAGQRVQSLRQDRSAIWQPRYFDFILRRVGDFWEKLEYIHENPVKAGFVRIAEDWPWSSAGHYRGGAGLIPMDPIELPGDRMAWLYPAPWRRA
jgi:putative transposase